MKQPPPTAASILVTKEGPLLWLTLNRPDRLNAVSRSLYEGLSSAVLAAEGDAAVRAVLLTGAGHAFCAGADLKAYAEEPPSDHERRAYVRAAQRANLVLQRCSRPVIAAVNGAAVGAGLELALSCDFIVVALDAKLRLPEIALATFFGGGITYTLPRRVGLGRAKELLLLGDLFSGAAAAEMGLANAAVPADQVAGAARELAARAADQAPISMRLAKRLLSRAPEMSTNAVLRAEARALLTCMRTKDWGKGVAAQRKGHAPRYSGE